MGRYLRPSAGPFWRPEIRRSARAAPFWPENDAQPARTPAFRQAVADGGEPRGKPRRPALSSACTQPGHCFGKRGRPISAHSSRTISVRGEHGARRCRTGSLRRSAARSSATIRDRRRIARPDDFDADLRHRVHSLITAQGAFDQRLGERARMVAVRGSVGGEESLLPPGREDGASRTPALAVERKACRSRREDIPRPCRGMPQAEDDPRLEQPDQKRHRWLGLIPSDQALSRCPFNGAAGDPGIRGHFGRPRPVASSSGTGLPVN